MTTDVLVLGVGNELRSDDGLGVHVARALQARRSELRKGVEVLDVGTATLDAIPEMSRARRVIVVDALRCGGEVGAIYRIEDAARGLAELESQGSISLHGWGLGDTFRAARDLGGLPASVTLLGAEPARLSDGLELSPEAASAAERVVELLLGELGEKGAP